jgi:hypothetical protein
VKIRSDRHDAFEVPPEDLWAAMAEVGCFRTWWPWLRELDATALEPGAVWSAVVQPPLPYRLRFDVHIVEVVTLSSVTARVTGDIEGSARLDIGATPTGSTLHLISELAPTSSVLRTVATLAGPVVRFGHEWVLDTGLRQFRDQALP